MANKWDERKKAQEDEYFVRKERELVAKLKAKQDAEAQESAKKASYMKCPKCGESLKERSFQKIAIDQCTGCNGIWLDPGELEQVAEKDTSSWLGKFWQKNG
ncbi:MAG TPA: zf-TFIIB domain-containing protein [Candidatus Saccharimonadales bacterium]|nr:zf-TFIIB domain-containing protein [Candidatus Saccharimonadales bacterium]